MMPSLHEACFRHAEHYKEITDRVDEMYLKGGQDLKAGLALLDAEWTNILAGQEWASVHSIYR
jgi:hypothetical protein